MPASYDMVREILLRVKDVTTLFRCAMVCKGWRTLIVADGSFLRRCLPEACRSCPFPGFFLHRTYIGSTPPCFRVSGNGRRFLNSFISRVPEGYFNYAVPLASRHGLLLIRLQPRSSGVKQGVLLAVCHLVSGAVHELPRLEHYRDFQQGSKVSGYALLTAADCSRSNDDNDVQRQSRFFKVLVVTVQHRRMHHVLNTFSSADDSGWITCSGVHGVPAMLRQHDAVVFGGAAHWLLGGTTGIYTLDVSAETGHVTATEMIGVPAYGYHNKYYGKPCFTVDGEGNLTVLRLRRDLPRLRISTSFDNGRSFHTAMLVLRQPDQQTLGTNDVYRCLGEKCGMMLVQVNDGCIYIVDVKTGVIWEAPDWPCSNGLSPRKIVPFEIDWPSFFSTRLAVAM